LVDTGAVLEVLKQAFTGMRVPLKIQAPLSLPASRSTASHWLQSSMTRLYRRIRWATSRRSVQTRIRHLSFVPPLGSDPLGAIELLTRLVLPALRD
jgi:hypothetical protein